MNYIYYISYHFQLITCVAYFYSQECEIMDIKASLPYIRSQVQISI